MPAKPRWAWRRHTGPASFIAISSPTISFWCPAAGLGGDDVRILDFGVAKLSQGSVDQPNTRTGALLGTPMFMAPEQCRGAGDIDARADIYSLGCILFAMVCGRPPFVHRQVGQLLAAHADDHPPSPRLFAATLSEAMAREILKTLAKDPDRRHQSMDELAAALEAVDLAHSRPRPGPRRDRDNAPPPMTEVLPLLHQRIETPFSAPGATKVMPTFKPGPSPRQERGNTTIGDSPVEVTSVGTARGARTATWVAAAAVGMLTVVAFALRGALSLPPPVPVEPARALEPQSPYPPEPPPSFNPPSPEPIAEDVPVALPSRLPRRWQRPPGSKRRRPARRRARKNSPLPRSSPSRRPAPTTTLS